MDSSNSGSFQSSSGAAAGDTEEYDSRTHSNINNISSFLNINPTTTNNNNNTSNHFNPNNLNHHHHHHHFLHQQPPHHRQPPTDTTFFNLNPIPTQPVLRHDRNLVSDFATYPMINSNNMMHTTTTTSTKPSTGSESSDHHIHNNIGVTLKNPKKRTRASRRAPTTVLTTDTTNFRQMVQEFTGIPTSPFSSTTTTTPLSRRLDLFRPTAHKLQQPPPFLNPTVVANNIIESSTTNNNNNNIIAATTSGGYHLQPSNMHDFQKQPSTLLDLQNPILSFQSLLQSNDLNGLQSSSKSWREQSDKLGNFEGDIGRSKLDTGLEHMVSSRSGEKVQGNQDSWICPSG
ncbi:uncharacterized protein LOC143569197 [Bidens hawaiensis]|uniref:uncharacterized protein LOC143569197 n=1 Tax=Bidens hawaiensis TaxID=980011 RepID=UPI00404A18C3